MPVFSIFTSKKRRQPKRSEPSPTKYYGDIAQSLSAIKIALLFILIIFVAYGFTFHASDLTIENFRYMLKFMSVDGDSSMNAGKEINYDGDSDTLFSILRGDVAIVNRSGIRVYDTAGQQLLHKSALFNDPLAVTNDKHLIVADRSSNMLNIYSSYSLLYTQEYPYPILSLAGSASGRYGVVTSALGYKSGVEVYDEEFRLIFKYYFADRYTTRLAISNDGKTVAVAAFTNDADGDYHSYFYLFHPDDSADPIKVFEFVGEVPFYVSFFDDGTLALLTNSALRFCKSDGSVSSTVYFAGKTVKNFFPSGGYYVLTFASAGLSNATTLSVYNTAGEHMMSRSVENDVPRVDIVDEYLYYYSSGVLCTVDLKSQTEDKFDDIGTDYLGLLYEPDGNNIIMFYKSIAKVYNKNDFPTENLVSPEQ